MAARWPGSLVRTSASPGPRLGFQDRRRPADQPCAVGRLHRHLAGGGPLQATGEGPGEADRGLAADGRQHRDRLGLDRQLVGAEALGQRGQLGRRGAGLGAGEGDGGDVARLQRRHELGQGVLGRPLGRGVGLGLRRADGLLPVQEIVEEVGPEQHGATPDQGAHEHQQRHHHHVR